LARATLTGCAAGASAASTIDGAERAVFPAVAGAIPAEVGGATDAAAPATVHPTDVRSLLDTQGIPGGLAAEAVRGADLGCALVAVDLQGGALLADSVGAGATRTAIELTIHAILDRGVAHPIPAGDGASDPCLPGPAEAGDPALACSSGTGLPGAAVAGPAEAGAALSRAAEAGAALSRAAEASTCCAAEAAADPGLPCAAEAGLAAGGGGAPGVAGELVIHGVVPHEAVAGAQEERARSEEGQSGARQRRAHGEALGLRCAGGAPARSG
jgi:hypothetical protein